jgi:putative transcriptional regulator
VARVGFSVIRILFKQLLDEKSFREKRRITVGEVSEVTGISRATLTRVANVPGYNTNTDTINALCGYFECEPKDLLRYVEGD